ncbi:MAG: uracil-DNA glycosylase [Pyrinomonadaceae bacterium]
MKRKNEFSNLITDLKEQILYLQELGVENFGIDLTEFDDSTFKNQSSKTEVSKQKLERFVPDDDVFKSEVLKSAIAPVIDKEKKETNNSRRNFLEQTRLSRLPVMPKRSSIFTTNQTQGENTEMPKKSAEEEIAPSLFGDVKKTLPESNETFEDIHTDIGNCTRCPLHEGRTKIVHSTGNRNADLMFVGEAPGADEDAKGEPFVGRAGQLLNKIIEAIDLKREDVFIGNINRCRPPGNRTPTIAEAETCKPFLLREIAIVRPKIIVVMGNTAMKNLLDSKEGITKLRGEFQDYYGIKVMPTFHPAYLLRDPRKKREVWEDMKKVRDELNKLK